MTTYYVDGAVGNDGNAGTSEGAGNAWATIDHAMNTVVAGDTVYVKDSVTSYNETATIDTAGLSTTPIIFEGYSSTPGDNGRVTIDGESTRVTCIDTALGVQIYYVFKNWRFTGALGDGVINNTGCDNIVFFNCRFDNMGGDGVEMDNVALFLHCQFDNNNSAFDNDNSQTFILCEKFGNNFPGNAGSARYVMCKAYEGFSNQPAFNQPGDLYFNVMDGDNSTNDGTVSQTSGAVILGNIIHDFQGDGIGNTLTSSYNVFWGYNLFSQIDGSNYQTANITVNGYGDVNNDTPAFTDEAANDYTLQATSPAVGLVGEPGLLA